MAGPTGAPLQAHDDSGDWLGPAAASVWHQQHHLLFFFCKYLVYIGFVMPMSMSPPSTASLSISPPSEVVEHTLLQKCLWQVMLCDVASHSCASCLTQASLVASCAVWCTDIPHCTTHAGMTAPQHKLFLSSAVHTSSGQHCHYQVQV